MISLHSILAIADVMAKLPTTIFAICGVALVLAFIVGFVKGFRKVSWDGLIWTTAGVAFVGVCHFYKPQGDTATGSIVISVSVALACVAVVLAVYGFLAYLIRPKMRWIKDNVNGDTSLAEYGLEFEPEYLDYDGEHDYAPYGKRIYKTGYGAPSFFGRLLGGLTCAINLGVVLAMVLGVVVLAIGATSLSQMNIGLLLENAGMRIVLLLSEAYLLEFLLIGLVILVAKKGYENGFISSIRWLIVTIGGFAAVIVSFYLPFSAYANATSGFFSYLNKLVVRCTGIFADVGMLNGILGKITAGICILAAFAVLLVLMNVLLKNIEKGINGIGLTRRLDGCLACVMYMVIGVVICMAIAFVLTGLDILGIFRTSEIIGDEAYFARALYEFAKSIIGPFLAS